MAVGIQAGMALGQLLDANHVQLLQLERTRAHFLTLQLARVVSNSACLQAIIAVANVLTSMVSSFCCACLLCCLTLIYVQFANDARVGGTPPCYPDNVAFPAVFMKTLKQFKGQGAGLPIQ